MTGIFGPLHEKSEASYRWFKMAEAKPFYETLRNWREYHLKTLKTSKDPIDVNRSQGALEVIERIMGLPDEIIKPVSDSVQSK